MAPDEGHAQPGASAAAAIERPPRPRAVRVGLRSPLVDLARDRLRRTTAARVGTLFASGVTVMFGGIAVALRVADGADATLAGLVVQAARVVAWLGGGSVALAAALDRASADRAEGLETLAAVRGLPSEALEAARMLAAMVQVAVTIAVPAAVLSALTIALSSSLYAAGTQAGVALATLVFAAATGVVLGGLANLSGRVGGRRGRWLLLAIVLGPWIAADLVGRGAWSVPGALDALLDLAVRLLSGVRP